MKTRDRTQHPLPHAALSGDPTDFQKWVGKPAYIPPNLLDAYSWSLHKLRREEVMVQQGGDEAGYEADRRWRENTWFSDCASLVQTLPLQDLCSVYCEFILRWNSRFDHPGFCGGVCCLRGVTQCWAKNQERRKKGLQLHPRAHHHCREPSIHSTLAPNHSPVTTDNYGGLQIFCWRNFVGNFHNLYPYEHIKLIKLS